jgi:large subunit ribosomal protein L18
MAKGPRYRVHFRRRRESKTDYRRRLKLLLSRKPRMVVRKSNKHIIVQLIFSSDKGDVTLVSANSADLSKYGFRLYKNNTPAAYLTGLLFGMKASANGHKDAVLDIGLRSPSSRILAALKGAIDGGLNIPCDETVFPSDERIRGEHIGYDPNEFERVKNKIISSHSP